MSRQDFDRAVAWGFGIIVGLGLGCIFLACWFGMYWLSVGWFSPEKKDPAPPNVEVARDAAGPANQAPVAQPAGEPVVAEPPVAPPPSPATLAPPPVGPDWAGGGSGGAALGEEAKPLSPPRDWVWREGLSSQVTMRGSLTGVQEGTILLRDSDGYVASVAMHALSEPDRQWLKENGFGPDLPPGMAEMAPAAPGGPGRRAPDEHYAGRDRVGGEPHEPRPAIVTLPKPWTDASGQHTTQARYLECHGGVAFLEAEDGAIIKVAMDQLSQEDRQYIEGMTFPAERVLVKVTGVVDGDTIAARAEAKTLYKVELRGIDAPERSQAYGESAADALKSKIFQKIVLVEWEEKDDVGRLLGDVMLDGRWINNELVEEGCAWHCPAESSSEVLIKAEKKARAAGTGLWKDRDPMAPWTYRESRPRPERPW